MKRNVAFKCGQCGASSTLVLDSSSFKICPQGWEDCAPEDLLAPVQCPKCGAEGYACVSPWKAKAPVR
jgi:hypothetical protein